MNQLMRHKDITRDVSTREKSSLLWGYDFREDNFQPLGVYHGDYFVRCITQADRPVIAHLHRILYFRDQTNMSLIKLRRH